MKFTKKLLTILPVASIGVITPMVISGCSCSSGYSINYGDSIDCKDNASKNYHSINDVKNAAKDHVQIEDQKTLHQEELISWETKSNQQLFYWDLIYSVANANTAFTLTWTLNDTKTECSGLNYNGTSYTSLKYEFDGSGVVQIKTNTNSTLVASYMYSLVKKA